MDPEQALKRAEDAHRRGDYDEMMAALADYWEWREKGGFMPAGGDKRATSMSREMYAGHEEARRIVGCLLHEDAAAMMGRLVVSWRAEDGKKSSESWGGYGSVDDTTLAQWIGEKHSDATKAILTDPDTGNVFARYRK